jgi:hypothetical protein
MPLTRVGQIRLMVMVVSACKVAIVKRNQVIVTMVYIYIFPCTTHLLWRVHASMCTNETSLRFGLCAGLNILRVCAITIFSLGFIHL